MIPSKIPPLFVIYGNPSDYPGQFVCRVWCGETPEPEPFAIADTLEGVRDLLPHWLYNLGRELGDDPAIMEVWI